MWLESVSVTIVCDFDGECWYCWMQEQVSGKFLGALLDAILRQKRRLHP